MLMERMWKILIVDDQVSNLEVLRGVLSATYSLVFAKSGEQALTMAHRHHPDLILLDIMMPGMDGYQTCRRLKADPVLRSIPVIFVTSMGDSEDEAKGFACGAVDYVTKPISAAVVKARVRTHIALVDQAKVLDCLGVAGEYRDNETGAHVRRMGRYAEILARHLGWGEEACQAIGQAAPMHDIGKIAVPDHILLKPGPLDAAEWDIMREHPRNGARIIGSSGSALMQMAARIALYHHEKWDGSGYPNGLARDAIPVEGRIVALADVYDALMSHRPYKEPWPLEQVIDYILQQSGVHFDPELVQHFLGSVDQFMEVRAALPD